MVDAPVSPTATQETSDQLAQRAVDELRRYCGGLSPVFEPALQDLIAEAVRSALSSAERRIEELVRDLGARERRIEELEIERANARESEAYATDCFREAHTALGAAESRLASLTGQVEDMRERAAKVADRMTPHHFHFETAAAIRSLPVLPTTGDGGEDDADLPDPSEVRGILKPTGRETSGEET